MFTAGMMSASSRHCRRRFQAAARRPLPAGHRPIGRPLVAAVQGAVGATPILLHCDLVVLAENALLSTPFVNLALVPEASSSLLMPLRIGYARPSDVRAR
jgi:enoyl-CoA hydratase/carnithine racemase